MSIRTPTSLTISCAVLMLAGCDQTLEPVGTVLPSETRIASAPTSAPFFDEFVDVNPCSGLDHTVTISGTAWMHEHGGQFVVRVDRTITTDTGFEGSGTHTIVDNGNIFKLTLNDVLTHPSGDRIRAHFTMVLDLSSSTVRVVQGAVTCVTS